MNTEIECQNSLTRATGPSSFRQVTNQYAMAILALLTLLCGAGASAQTAAYSGSTGMFDATDYTAPQGIATDASGDVFIADNGGTPTVYEMMRTGPGTYSAPVALPNPTPGYTFLKGVTIDSNGNLWVADNANGTGGQVYELAYLSGSFGSPTKVGTGWTGPWQIAADASGNVFVTDNSANSITEISGGTATVVNTGSVSAPRGIAVDSTENLFVVDANLGQVVKLAPPYTSAVSVNLTGFQGPGDIAIDASGNIWVAAYSANLIRELTYASGYATIESWGSGLSGPLAVWPETGGTLLVSDDGDHSIRQIATGSINAGIVAVNATSTTQTLAFTFTGASSTTIEAPQVLTGGATGQDFADAGTGTCTTANGAGNPYASGATCTVVVNLKPKYPGPRNGAVELLNSSGAVLATAFIYGTGSGPEVAFPGNTTVTALGGGFSQPFGVALDGSGSVYVADKASTSIAKVPTGCAASSCVTTLGGGFVNPTGVAVDGAGNVYVADQGNNAVKEVPAGCASSACVTTLGGGFGSPLGVAVDGSGNVYVADNSKDAVDEMPAGCTSASCVTALGAGFGSPTGVAVDGSGNVYVTGSGSVKEMTPGCVSDLCVTALGGGFNTPIGVTVDGGGNVYVGDYGTNHVNEIPVGCASSTCVATLGGGFSAPAGVALDGAGNLYVGDSGNIAVKELSLATPPSLSFATTNTGSQSSDSPQAVTLSNIGNAPLSMPVPGTGTNPSASDDFTLDASTTCPQVTPSSSAGTLAAGGSCSLEVDFSPRTIGAISGAVVLTDNNLNASPSAMQSIGLSGTATSLIVPYVQVNGGAWQQTGSVTVNPGDTVNLAGQPLTGTWSWTGPNGFTSASREIEDVALPSGTTVYTATYTSTGGDTSRLDFTITVNSTPITPYLQVNGGAWQQTASTTVNLGTTVNLAGQQLSTGTWSWSGPNGYTAATRVIDAVPLPLPTNTYVLTYTNASGVTSTQAFTVTVNSTAILPYIQVNGGAWQQVASATVNVGDTVNLSGQQLSTGSWSWTGPNSYTAATRTIDAVPLTSPTNIYTLTYTNASGVTSTQAFTVTVNSTAILPYVQVNGGAWQQTASVTVSAGSTVNLAGQQLSTGTWSWTGPSGFTAATRVISAPLTTPTDSYTLTYTNAAGVNSTQTFTVTVTSTPIVPSIQVNGGAWQQTASATVYAGDTVNLEGQLLSTGSWSWTGPSGFTAATRVINAVPLRSATNSYTLTYTAAGVTSTQVFTLTVRATPIIPYIQVNGGAWQQTASVSVNVGDTVNLGGQQLSTGTWSWTGPSGFTAATRVIDAISLKSATNSYTLTYTAAGVSSTQVFTVTVKSTPITPYIQVNGGAWQQVATATVNVGDTVNLSGQQQSTGSWSWTGPNSYTAATRTIDAVPLTSPTNTYTLTYTNADGVTSTQAFTVTVNSTPIVPYIEVNGGPWQQTASATVTAGTTVNLAGQQLSTGTWSWTGPNGFTAATRVINAVPLASGANSYTLKYTNASGVQSTQIFTITDN